MKKQRDARTPSSLSFTVFTPTYNRAHTLEKVYESLKAQTYKNFEWVIVDDGSIDNTAETVAQWSQDGSFPIHYAFQVNQGKHVAFNKGVDMAHGLLFVPLDSDDTCTPDALERLWAVWTSIPETQRDAYSGVCVLCLNHKGEPVGDPFPGPVMDSTASEVTYKYKIKGEKWGCHRTEILKAYPFPVLEGAKYIPESLIWNQIGQHYKMRCVNEALRIYDQGPAPDRLTCLSLTDSFLLGRLYFYEWSFNQNSSWIYTAPWQFFKYALQYGRFSNRLGLPWREQLQKLSSLEGKIFLFLAAPLSFLLSWWDQQQQTPSAPEETPS